MAGSSAVGWVQPATAAFGSVHLPAVPLVSNDLMCPTSNVPLPTSPTRVLLLHGIWNSRLWVVPMAWRLRQLGFEVETFGYPSILGGPQVAVPRLVQVLRQRPAVAVVGHSLGGLVALEALRQAPQLAVARVVCLGAPLRGSGTARRLGARGLRAALGRSAQLLDAGVPAWAGVAQVGMITGRTPRGLGSVLGAVQGYSDGTVAEHETQLPGLHDCCHVQVTHSGLLLSAQVALQAAHFIREGRFSPQA